MKFRPASDDLCIIRTGTDAIRSIVTDAIGVGALFGADADRFRAMIDSASPEETASALDAWANTRGGYSGEVIPGRIRYWFGTEADRRREQEKNARVAAQYPDDGEDDRSFVGGCD